MASSNNSGMLVRQAWKSQWWGIHVLSSVMTGMCGPSEAIIYPDSWDLRTTP